MNNTRFEQFTQVVLLGVSLLAGYAIVEQHFITPRKAQSGQDAKALVGKKPTLPLALWEKRTNIVLAIRSDCQYCLASVPFYRTLTALVHEPANKGKLSLSVVSPDPQETTHQFLAAEGVEADHVFSTALPSIGLHSTPTLLLVDGGGTIRAAYIGRLPEDGQAEVIRLVKGTP
jgi:hypothetical protein